MGIAPTGKLVMAMGIDIVRVVDDEILDYWGEFDVMGLLRQLGVTLDHSFFSSPSPAAWSPSPPPAFAASIANSGFMPTSSWICCFTSSSENG